MECKYLYIWFCYIAVCTWIIHSGVFIKLINMHCNLEAIKYHSPIRMQSLKFSSQTRYQYSIHIICISQLEIVLPCIFHLSTMLIFSHTNWFPRSVIGSGHARKQRGSSCVPYALVIRTVSEQLIWQCA